jgi:hypothetical protein
LVYFLSFCVQGQKAADRSKQAAPSKQGEPVNEFARDIIVRVERALVGKV